MAKKHNEQSEENQMANGSAFVLEAGKYDEVESHVGTLNVDYVSDDGSTQTLKLAKSDLQVKKTRRYASGKTEEYDTWRFASTRYMPFARRASTRDELLQSIADFMDDLVAFDNVNDFVLPNGKTGKKSYRLLVDAQGEPIDVVSYIDGLLRAAHTLASQKTMQTKLRAIATDKVREERELVAPDKKVRTKKPSDALAEDDAAISNDL